MVVAIVCGLLSGVVGFVPLFIGLRLTKRVTATSNFGYMSILIISLVVSFGIMFGIAAICIAVARDMAMPFVLSEAVALSIVAIVFGFKRLRSNGNER